MLTDGGGAVDEHSPLASYLLGALGEDEREDFEEHLARCDRCLAESLDLGPVTSGFGGFTAEEAAVFARAEPVTVPPETPARPAGPVRPGGTTRPAGGPGKHRRRRKVAAFAGIAAVVLAAAIGVGTYYGVRGDDQGVVLTGTAQATAAGTTMSAVLNAEDAGHTAVHVTVSGLRPGIRYGLVVVTQDGQPHKVREWQAAGGTEEVIGEADVAAGDFAFVTIATTGGTAVVTAPIRR